MIRYVELESGYHDDGPAWIARVLMSKSGRTVYFNGKALKRTTQGGSGNYYDVQTSERYWVSGVKKKGGDRHQEVSPPGEPVTSPSGNPTTTDAVIDMFLGEKPPPIH
jgi:hypothetical protein